LGYWLVAIAIITLTVISYYLWRRFKRTKLKRLALSSYKQIIADYQKDKDAKKLTQQLSALLRNAAINSYGREQFASLPGIEWLSLLDQQIQSKNKTLSFSQNCQQLLTRFNYSQDCDHAEIKDFINLSHQWLNHLPPPHLEVSKQCYILSGFGFLSYYHYRI